MGFLSRLFRAKVGPDLGGAAVVQAVLTTVGVFTFLAGALYLPTLEPTRVEAIILLLLLGTLALLCTAVGQLAVVIERLECRPAKANTLDSSSQIDLPSSTPPATRCDP